MLEASVLLSPIIPYAERVINGPVSEGSKPSLMRPDFAYRGFEDIDFAEMHTQHGINTLLLDAEGTFLETDSWEVKQDAIDKILKAKEQGIQNVAIISNKHPRDDITFLKMTKWGMDIGADIVFTPHDPAERKPGPSMFLKAYEYYKEKGVTPGQMLAVGDKLSAEVVAANQASNVLNTIGVEGKIKTVWVDRRGKNDLIFDRIARRPFENVVARKMGINAEEEQIYWEIVDMILETAPNLQEIDELNSLEEPPFEFTNKKKQGVSDEILDHSHLIEGYGNAPTVSVTEEMLENMPGSRFYKKKEEIEQQVKELIGDERLEKIDQFLHKHGRKTADILTYSRIPGAAIVAGLVLKEKYAAACAAHLAFMATDALDGPAAGKSAEGKTKEGGKRDQRIDKFYSVVVEAALAYKGRIGWEDFFARLGREGITSYERHLQHKHGVDTSATLGGKVSTNVATYADTIALFTDGNVTEVVQKLATITKWASFLDARNRWKLNYMKNREDIQEASKMFERLQEEV